MMRMREQNWTNCITDLLDIEITYMSLTLYQFRGILLIGGITVLKHFNILCV